CFNGEDNLYITNEEYISLVEQSLWWVDISNRLGQISGSNVNKELIDDINILPNKLEHLVNAEIVCKKDFTSDVYIVNAQKKILGVIKSRKFTNGYNQIKVDVEELKPGNYILMCIDKNQNIIKSNFSIPQ
ncbi:MAG: hypothetical protein HYZ42_17565, partial [Bacteroidetes bacterium]|nr:hypothetical protein [Bacteroidota bacterium]